MCNKKAPDFSGAFFSSTQFVTQSDTGSSSSTL